MAKWADCGISKVRYDGERTHIVKARVHEDRGDTIAGAEEWLRNQVVSAIEGGNTLVTILDGNEGKW